MFGLRKVTQKSVADTVSGGLSTAGNSARNGANAAYSAVMNHPKTTGAVVLGTAVAAGIWWVFRNPERVEALRKQIASRTDALRNSRLAKLASRERQPTA
jgi:hypothetical protein